MFAGALVLLDRRPLVAGLLFGALACKPQFGVMIPLVLIATGRWCAFAAAAAAVAALIGVTAMPTVFALIACRVTCADRGAANVALAPRPE